MGGAFRAGLTYGAGAFCVGFLLGTVRVLLLEPRVGALAAALLEAPVILTASWHFARWVMGRFEVPPRWIPRAVAGAIAFLLLQALEVGLAILLFGQTLGDYASGFASTPAGTIGLPAQIAFALIPLAQILRR